MLRYLLQRVLWAVPATLAAALAVLLIGELAPQDWVAAKLEGSAGRYADSNTANARQAMYRKIRSRYGLDLPVFYISINSLSEPDTLNSIFPAALRNLAGRTLNSYGNWQTVSDYISYVSEVER
ncbi:MAG: hypothetical protein WBH03_20530, partial [Cyclobacteriaceae bacterium]